MTHTFSLQKYSVLNARDLRQICQASLGVLESVGVKIVDSGLRQILQEAGAAISGEIVRLPERLVVDALRQAPPVVTFYSRDGKSLSSQERRGYHSPAPSAVTILEPGGRRPSTYQDVADLTRLADALPGIDFISPPAVAQDGPETFTGVRTAEAVFCNTHKFCLAFPLNLLEAQAWLSLAQAAAGSLEQRQQRPTIGFAISPISPLVLAKESSDILLAGVRSGIPIITVPGGMSGATNPYSLAGTLVVDHAEALLVAAIAQVVRPGAPVVLGLATATMDMRSGNVSLGRPERTLILNAVAPLAHAWGLPAYAPAGLTDSIAPDYQAGAEKMLSILTQLQSGLEFSAGAGRYEGGLSTCLEGLLLDHQLVQMARRHMQGIQVNSETLAEAAIRRVGPAGDYLADAHTLRFLRSDEWIDLPLFNRRSQTSGGSLAADMARRAARDLLAAHLSPVSDGQQAGYREIARCLMTKKSIDSTEVKIQ
jgi:trimethylamine--corrinoid protein Co-methyltransferase